MPRPNPFDFIASTDVTTDTEQELMGKENPFDAHVAATPSVRFQTQVPDIGLGGSFVTGLKAGIVDPLVFITGREDPDERIDSPGEKTVNFLGLMVGFGVSFVPIVKGTGFALRGVGLTANLSKNAASFVTNVLAGGVQFAGSSEELEDIPKNLATGLAFGAAAEFLFARALRGRAVDAKKPKSNTSNTGNPTDNVSISPETLSGENVLAPTDAKLPARIADEVVDLNNEALDINEVISGLTEVHQTTAMIRGLDDATALVNHARGRVPEAQILVRDAGVKRGKEVLIHNPVDPEDFLTDAQVKQFTDNRYFEGLEVELRGNTHVATGRRVEPGKIELRGLQNPSLKYVANLENITIPQTPRVFTERAATAQALSNAIISNTSRVGFVVNAGEEGVMRQGLANTDEFLQVNSLKDFVNANRETILNLEHLDPAAAMAQVAKTKGIKGLTIFDEEAGMALEYHIFDQSVVENFSSMSSLGQAADQAVLGVGANGLPVVQSFVPSWRNSIAASLRADGTPEKLISEALDMHADNLGRRMNNLMDDEFTTLARESELQFANGCI